MQDAKLLEAAVRNLAMFSARTKEALKLASEIALVADTEKRPALSPTTPQGDLRQTPGGVVLPSGVDPTKQPEMRGPHISFDQDDLPDDSERKVESAVPDASMNKEGSFESLLSFVGHMKSRG